LDQDGNGKLSDEDLRSLDSEFDKFEAARAQTEIAIGRRAFTVTKRPAGHGRRRGTVA
jgi:hypothetical protein